MNGNDLALKIFELYASKFMGKEFRLPTQKKEQDPYKLPIIGNQPELIKWRFGLIPSTVDFTSNDYRIIFVPVSMEEESLSREREENYLLEYKVFKRDEQLNIELSKVKKESPCFELMQALYYLFVKNRFRYIPNDVGRTVYYLNE